MRRCALAFILAALLLLPAAGAEEVSFEVRAKKFSYSPNIITVNKGDVVTITLVSEDVSHGFYLDGYEIEMSVRPGETASLTFTADKTGKFSFRCSVTCGAFHPYMVGNLIVEPNTTFTATLALALGIGLLALAMPFIRRKKEAAAKAAEEQPGTPVTESGEKREEEKGVGEKGEGEEKEDG